MKTWYRKSRLIACAAAFRLSASFPFSAMHGHEWPREELFSFLQDQAGFIKNAMKSFFGEGGVHPKGNN